MKLEWCHFRSENVVGKSVLSSPELNQGDRQPRHILAGVQPSSSSLPFPYNTAS